MKTLETAVAMQVASAGARALGQRIGFVPTMGALHEGHLSLVRAARERSDLVVTSIFVNPTQFGPGEDYRSYPRNFEADAALLRQEGVDVLFAPTPGEVYPEGFQTSVRVDKLSEPLCGRFRPGHFQGVATVVSKLFNIVQPDLAFFGRKDYQQSLIIRRLVRDLNFPLEVVVCPIVREPDGLAMSSRNAYLSREERRAALVLSRSLRKACELLTTGETRPGVLLDRIGDVLRTEPLARPDYFEVVDAETLEPVEQLTGKILVVLAVWVGQARLIDNLVAERQPDGRWQVEL